VRLFELFLNQDNAVKTPEAVNVFLAACKFLDLLFVLQTEEFQV
jgi:hypothetical protein